jgi:protein arginine kinase activator
MLCQICNKNVPSVHLTKKTNGKIIEVYLCDQCANKHNGFLNPPHNVNDFVANFINVNIKTSKTQNLQCKSCGTTFKEIQVTGKLGCAECYTTFSNKLISIIKNIHGNVKYEGKPPKNYTKSPKEIRAEQLANKSEKVTSLKVQLQQAIQKEEYEKAAIIRDKIKLLEKS